jgi:hypothetical protein
LNSQNDSSQRDGKSAQVDSIGIRRRFRQIEICPWLGRQIEPPFGFAGKARKSNLDANLPDLIFWGKVAAKMIM